MALEAAPNARPDVNSAGAPRGPLLGMAPAPLAWWGAAEMQPNYLYQAQFVLRRVGPWVLAVLLLSWLVSRLVARVRARQTRRPGR